MRKDTPATSEIAPHSFHVNLTPRQISRFWNKIRLIGASDDECWVWTRATTGMGHGVVRMDGANHGAHRIAYFLGKGTFDSRLNVCHACDNPPCCNPNHLWIGTQSDNLRDMFAKNRRPSAKGTRHASAKLNDDLVREIREIYARGGISTRALAVKYGVDYSGIHGIVTRKYWKHVV